jgi:hypothetical protein
MILRAAGIAGGKSVAGADSLRRSFTSILPDGGRADGDLHHKNRTFACEVGEK